MQPPYPNRRRILLVLFCLLAIPIPALGAIYRLEVDGAINPVMVEYITDGIKTATEAKAEAILLLLRTPGGLLTSMNEIMEQMVGGEVPIIAYVSPSGAQAASAGFFLLISADVAAMAPGTRTGAAHPILAFGNIPISQNETAKTLVEKVTNDSVALLKSIAQRRGRNEEMAVKAIQESASYTENQALDGKLIEIVANTEEDLLQVLEGRQIRLFNNRMVVLHTAKVPIVNINLTFRQKILMAVSNPNLALLLGVGGILMLVFEFANPGLLAPGIIGGFCLLLSLLGFSFLPINYVGVLLILAALALFILEIKVQGFGLLGLTGIVSMIIGCVVLIKSPDPSLRIHASTAIILVLPFAALFLILLYLALASRKFKVATGKEAMVGMEGRSLTALQPEGMVMVCGEYWEAISDVPIKAEQTVLVVAVNNLTLKVKPKN